LGNWCRSVVKWSNRGVQRFKCHSVWVLSSWAKQITPKISQDTITNRNIIPGRAQNEFPSAWFFYKARRTLVHPKPSLLRASNRHYNRWAVVQETHHSTTADWIAQSRHAFAGIAVKNYLWAVSILFEELKKKRQDCISRHRQWLWQGPVCLKIKSSFQLSNFYIEELKKKLQLCQPGHRTPIGKHQGFGY